MSAFRAALADLIITAVALRGDPDEAFECAQAVLAELPDADATEHLPALRRLRDALSTAPLAGAGVLALTAAAVVESGGPPGVALGPVLERLEEALEPAGVFVAACQAMLRREPSPRLAVERLGDQVASTHPKEAVAWDALEPLGLAALAMLTREALGRDRARERTGLVPRLRTLRAAHERAEQILDVLDVFDGVQLLVLIPERNEGRRVEVEGVADVGQLLTLLGEGVPVGSSRLRTSDPLQAIPVVEGARVLVLAPGQPVPTPRRYEAMPASVRTVLTLTPDEARTWFERCRIGQEGEQP
jgi:hypothetical protein